MRASCRPATTPVGGRALTPLPVLITLDPSASMMLISVPGPPGAVYAILDPSGDHTGSRSMAGLFVRFT